MHNNPMVPNRYVILGTARDALESVTPLRGDCGKRCGAACCQPDANGQGSMILFPGEEMFYHPTPDWAVIAPGHLGDTGVSCAMLTCKGQCDRAMRPLACRIFPLTPIVEDGNVRVIMDVRAWPLCPLMPHGSRGLSDAFVTAVQTAMEGVWQDPACRAYIIALSAHLRAYTKL